MDSTPRPHGPDPVTPAPVPPAADAVPPEDEALLPPRTWLMRNGIYLILFAALVGFIIFRYGLGTLGGILVAALGLGLVIFIHELGHFLVAKWCDVYVETFSIGFGPALPGCRFKWGETVYMIALLPLGGYVKMLGEGSDNDEEENNPRSYKNKTVPQRMAIISAGVVMNVLLACLCFIGVYTYGREQPAGVVGLVEAGGPLWQKGIPSGSAVVQIDGQVGTDKHPLFFPDLQRAVIGSSAGVPIRFGFEYSEPGADPGTRPERLDADIEPRKDKDDTRPMIGVAPADKLQLVPEVAAKVWRKPVRENSAADAARAAFPFRPGDIVVATTDPDHPDQMLPLPAFKAGDATAERQHTFELAQRWMRLAGKPMALEIRHQGQEQAERVDVAPATFAWGDIIVATTDPEHPDTVKPLPPDPRHPQGGLGDFFVFHQRMQQLAGRFVTIRVRRGAEVKRDAPPVGGTEVDLVVPPAYHHVLGVRMRMGQVSALRVGSRAAEMGVQPGDTIKEVELTDAENNKKRFVLSQDPNAKAAVELVDPVRLPTELRDWAATHPGTRVRLTVVRLKGNVRAAVTLPEGGEATPWDYADRWRYDLNRVGQSLALAELGLAYKVDNTIEEVTSRAAEEGLRKLDQITAYRYKRPPLQDGPPIESDWVELKENQFATLFIDLQAVEIKDLTLRVKRPDEKDPVEVAVQCWPDGTWPLTERGLRFATDTRLQIAENLGQAVMMGLKDTLAFIGETYQNLRSLGTGRLSVKNIGGPATIAYVAYQAASENFWQFVFFIGLISINLAVINFLPIPFLDGGHMVFLLYELVRGKPAPESVQAALTWCGLLLLLTLMLFVFWIESDRFGWLKFF